MDFKLKYLKYKDKYLKLKKMYGGGDGEDDGDYFGVKGKRGREKGRERRLKQRQYLDTQESALNSFIRKSVAAKAAAEMDERVATAEAAAAEEPESKGSTKIILRGGVMIRTSFNKALRQQQQIIGEALRQQIIDDAMTRAPSNEALRQQIIDESLRRQIIVKALTHVPDNEDKVSDHTPQICRQMLVWNIESNNENHKRIMKNLELYTSPYSKKERYEFIARRLILLYQANPQIEVIGLQEFDGKDITEEYMRIFLTKLAAINFNFYYFSPKTKTLLHKTQTNMDHGCITFTKRGCRIYHHEYIKTYGGGDSDRHEVESILGLGPDNKKVTPRYKMEKITEFIHYGKFVTSLFIYNIIGTILYVNLHGKPSTQYDLNDLKKNINYLLELHYVNRIYIGGDFNKRFGEITDLNIKKFSTVLCTDTMDRSIDHIFILDRIE
jgi:hypothetical protein